LNTPPAEADDLPPIIELKVSRRRRPTVWIGALAQIMIVVAFFAVHSWAAT
jgi:hypothetical protein